MRIKAAIVAADEFESSDRRAKLNFGHTVGHAIEAAAGYGRFLHGEAVAMGLAVAADLSVAKSGLPPADRDLLLARLTQFELPTRIPADLSIQRADGSAASRQEIPRGRHSFRTDPRAGQRLSGRRRHRAGYRGGRRRSALIPSPEAGPMNQAEARIALNMVPQMGPVRLRKLLEVFGEPARILGASRDQLAAVEGIGRELATGLSRWEDHIDLPAELARMREANVSVVTEADENYPKLLRTIHDPPIVLYVWGEPDRERWPRIRHCRLAAGFPLRHGMREEIRLSARLRRVDGLFGVGPRHRHLGPPRRAGREGTHRGGDGRRD